MTRTLFLALAASLAVAAPAQAGGLLGLLGDVVSSNVSNPRNDPAVQAEQDFYDHQTRDERQPNSAVQAEQDFYDNQSRAERDYLASRNR